MNTEEKKLQEYLQKIRFKDKISLNQEDIKASFEKIKERIDLPTEEDLRPVKRVNIFTTMPFRVAASILIVLTLGLSTYNYYDGQKQIRVANDSELVKQIALPDGTKITLRSKSTLSYSKNFSSNRNVDLHGEALFEVTKDKNHPFTVKTKLGKITVLGTVFSVRSYAEESYTNTLLKEGSVKLSDNNETVSIVLQPGEEARLNKDKKDIKVRKVENVDHELTWASHNFCFENEKLDKILTIISSSFEKKLILNDISLGKKKFTLKFNRNESLTKILDVLSEVAKFKYRINNDTIIVDKL